MFEIIKVDEQLSEDSVERLDHNFENEKINKQISEDNGLEFSEDNNLVY